MLRPLAPHPGMQGARGPSPLFWMLAHKANTKCMRAFPSHNV